jgi:hypothetical protein
MLTTIPHTNFRLDRGRNPCPFAPTALPRPGSRTKCLSFLNNFTKSLGLNKEKDEGKKEEASRSTLDKNLLGSDSGAPVFPPYTVIRKTGEYSLR